jgi:hypothetical protein
MSATDARRLGLLPALAAAVQAGYPRRDAKLNLLDEPVVAVQANKMQW